MKRPALSVFAVILLLCLSWARPTPAQTITTYTGNDAIFAGTGQQATAVQIPAPRGVAVDSQGNIYVSSITLAMILKVAPSGAITVAAGNGLNRYAGDGGPAVAASLAGRSEEHTSELQSL